MQFSILYVVCMVSVAANSAERSLEEQSQTFQDDEEFELFYDVLKEISENGKAEEPEQEEPSGEGITTRPMEPEEGDTSPAAPATEAAAAVPALPREQEEEEEDILEDSVEEVISHYEGGLVQIIRQAERAQEEENEKQFVGVAVGGGVAGVMLLVLTALAGLFFLRKRRSRRRSSSKEGKQSTEQPCDYSPVANAV
jgi:hypothetical protein